MLEVSNVDPRVVIVVVSVRLARGTRQEPVKTLASECLGMIPQHAYTTVGAGSFELFQGAEMPR